MLILLTGLITLIFFILLFVAHFTGFSGPLNVIVLIALFFLISKDLEDTDHHKYYIFALLVAALAYFMNASLLLDFGKTFLLAPVTMAAVLVYIFAFIIGFVHIHVVKFFDDRRYQ